MKEYEIGLFKIKISIKKMKDKEYKSVKRKNIGF